MGQGMGRFNDMVVDVPFLAKINSAPLFIRVASPCYAVFPAGQAISLDLRPGRHVSSRQLK